MRQHPTFTLENIAGGDLRTFPWTGHLSREARRHLRRLEGITGGPVFSGEAKMEAWQAWEQEKEAER